MVEAGSHDETRRMTESFHRIGVIGAGAMGRGIAQLFASAGLPVRLYDSNPQTVEQALAFNRELLERAVAKGKLSPEALAATMQRLLPTHSLDELADCDLLIEAIIEDLGAKQALLAELEKRVAPDAVLASNTSSLSITRIAARCRHPERVAGFHFFNPVTLMRIVEVVHGQRTDESVVRRLSRLAEQAGHFPAVSPDSPGFIVNHAGRAFSTEALRILGEGIASPAQIDRILRDGVGFRMGPFELLDLTGLDVSHAVMESLYQQFYQDPRYTPSPLAAQRVAGGLLGRKSGEGFYRYRDGQPCVKPKNSTTAYCSIARTGSTARTPNCATGSPRSSPSAAWCWRPARGHRPAPSAWSRRWAWMPAPASTPSACRLIAAWRWKPSPNWTAAAC